MATPTTIDELVVTLGLDPSEFTKGQKDALASFKKTRDDATATAKEMSARGSQGAEFFGKITGKALELFALLVGANTLEKFVAGTITGMSALGRTARLMGESVSDLQAFRLAVQRNGGDADAATASFLALSEAMTRWRTLGQIDPNMLLGMARIGGQSSDDPLTIFQKFARWSQGKDPRLVNQEGQLLGLDPGSINEALRGGPQVAQDLADSYKAGVPSPADVAKVQGLQRAFNTLKQEVQGEANALIYEASPALTRFLQIVSGQDKTSKLGGELRAIADDAGKVGTAVEGLWKAFSEVTGIKSLDPFLAALDHQFRALAALIRALTDALTLLHDVATGNWQGAADAAKREAADWIDYGKEQLATIGVGPGAGQPAAGAPGAPASNLTPDDIVALARQQASGKPAGPGSQNVQDAEKTLYGVFTAAGLNPDAAIAAIAQLRAESGLNPHNVNPHSAGLSHATGIGQWLKSRADNFMAWSGHSLMQSNVEEEGRFAMYEAARMPGFMAAMNAAKTDQERIGLWTKFFGLGGMHGKGAVGDQERAAYAYDVSTAQKYLSGIRGVVGGGAPRGGPHSSSVQIGTIHIHAAAATARAIAGSLGSELRTQVAAQANGGPQ